MADAKKEFMGVDGDVHEAAPTPTHPLSPLFFDGSGIYYVNGIPSHSRGDEYARKVISGEIPYAEACADRRRGRAMRNSVIRRESW